MKDIYGKEINIKNKKLFLLDMDGTIYLGNSLFEGVNEFLNALRKRDSQFVFVTNNSSKSVESYLEKLERIGVKNITSSNFYTSSQATIQYIKSHFSNPKIYVQGTSSFVKELSNEFNVVTDYDKTAELIVVGFDTELTFEKMNTTSKMLTNVNVPYIATNPDWVCPTEYGYVPDCGSMCFSYEKATGRKPIFIGKPEPQMINIVSNLLKVSKDQILVIGDRIYTDIKAGINANVDTICVLSGEVKKEDVDASIDKPTYTISHIKDLLEIL